MHILALENNDAILGRLDGANYITISLLYQEHNVADYRTFDHRPQHYRAQDSDVCASNSSCDGSCKSFMSLVSHKSNSAMPGLPPTRVVVKARNIGCTDRSFDARDAPVTTANFRDWRKLRVI